MLDAARGEQARPAGRSIQDSSIKLFYGHAKELADEHCTLCAPPHLFPLPRTFLYPNSFSDWDCFRSYLSERPSPHTHTHTHTLTTQHAHRNIIITALSESPSRLEGAVCTLISLSLSHSHIHRPSHVRAAARVQPRGSSQTHTCVIYGEMHRQVAVGGRC